MTKDLIIIEEAQGEIGTEPENRSVETLLKYGIINIDKIKGPTSHQVSDYVQKILGLKKAGHSGTLDPAVTGVQPVAIGRATKITQFLLKSAKEYICVMHVHKDLEPAYIKEALSKFVGKIQQMPPVKSAVKRQLRTREIYELEVLEVDKRDVLFRVKCEAGTYIRALCLHPQTNVLTKDGAVSASNFYVNPSKIYSFHNGKMVEKKHSAVQKIKSPSKLIEFTMKSGVKFSVTLDHKMFVSTEEGYKMIEAEKLTKGSFIVKSLVFPQTSKKIVISDLLDDNYYIQQKEIKEKCKRAFINKYGSIRAMSRKLNLDRKTFIEKSNNAITIKHLKLAGVYEKLKESLFSFKTQKGNVIKIKRLSSDFFYLLGLVASDGNNTKEKKTVRHTRIAFHNKEKKLNDIFLKKYKEIFPNFTISKEEFRPNLWKLTTSNSFFATIAANLGIKSPQKNSDILPILNFEPKLVKSFLRGYFDGDGSVYFKKTKTNHKTNHKTKISFHTVNHNDAINLHKMLLKINIPNVIFQMMTPKSKDRKRKRYYEVRVGNISAQKKFIEDVGSNHPKKIEKFSKIIKLQFNEDSNEHYHVGLHFKELIRKNKKQLYSMGGNLHRILSSEIPITRRFYQKALKKVKLPNLDEFIIEKIVSVKTIKSNCEYVYDMTVPKTHNFLIESGFVSSNCNDVGKKIGGAHMAALRRTAAGAFDENDNLVTLDDLRDALWYYREKNNEKYIRHCIQPVEHALKYIKKAYIFDSAILSLSHGRDLGAPGISKLENFKKGETVAIMTLKGEVVACGIAEMSAVQISTERKGLAVKTSKVFYELSEEDKMKLTKNNQVEKETVVVND